MTKKSVGKYYWVRVVVMCISLVGIITLIAKLNKPGALIPSSTESVNVCPTRVSSVSVIGKAAIFQQDLKWYRAQSGAREELDHIAVEKWFSEYCKVPVETAAAPQEEMQPVVTMAYVAGVPVTLQRSTGGVFSWNGRQFRSPQLDQALSHLLQIPVAKTPGQKPE